MTIQHYVTSLLKDLIKKDDRKKKKQRNPFISTWLGILPFLWRCLQKNIKKRTSL